MKELGEMSEWLFNTEVSMGTIILRKKTKQVLEFLEKLHEHLISSRQFRRNTANKSETQVQTELRPIILNYLVNYFEDHGYKDPMKKAYKSFYWEGQEGEYGKKRGTTFGARNYPDFIITLPYLIAIEYKQSMNGGLVKQGIGQSIMHTVSKDFDFVYYLFHDQNKDKKIAKSINGVSEKFILDTIWKDFNVLMKIYKPHYS